MLFGFYAKLIKIGYKHWKGVVYHESSNEPVFTVNCKGFNKEQAGQQVFEQFRNFYREKKYDNEHL